MIVSDLEPLAAPLDKLSLLPGNPRRGDVEAVARSLDAFGQRKPIVARRDGTVIAGNHTLQAARQLGWDRLAVVWVDDDETTAKAFALADNRTAELGGYDEQALADLIREVGDVDAEVLAATGWGDDAVAALLASLEPEILPTVFGDPDEVPDSAPGHTVLGDVWLLGPHRLLCGDAFDPTLLDRLLAGRSIGCLLMDPPYGMDLDTNYAKIGAGTAKGDVLGNNYRPVIGDDQAFDPTVLLAELADVDEQFWWGADYYRRFIPDGGGWLVWDKRVEGLEDAVGNAFELCWSKRSHKRLVLRHLWSGFTARERGERRVHPTQKPVAMLAEILETWAKPGIVVLDSFAGSGATLLAAHQTGRVAYLMELDPGYCDVICKRWQKATGIMPIAESTGNAHDFCEDDG